MHDLFLTLDNRIVKYYIGFMNTNNKQVKAVDGWNIEGLSNDFKMSDKQTLILIKDLFEMIKDNNQLIQLLDKRIKILELKLKN